MYKQPTDFSAKLSSYKYKKAVYAKKCGLELLTALGLEKLGSSLKQTQIHNILLKTEELISAWS